MKRFENYDCKQNQELEDSWLDYMFDDVDELYATGDEPNGDDIFGGD